MRRQASLLDITEELQVVIFSKLDVKSVLSCKCVCKHFCYILEDPNFVKSHLNNQIDSQSQVLVHYGADLDSHPFFQLHHCLFSFDIETKDITSCLPLTPPIPYIDGLFRSYVVGSCNGLICLAIWFDDYSKFFNRTSMNGKVGSADFLLLLWNPVIRQCRFLPKHQSSCTPDVLEFGYLPETDDYVIVKVGSPGFHLEVYKTNTDSWTTIDFNWLDIADFIPTVNSHHIPVFVNGSFHWAVKDSTFNCVVYFNLKDEELGLIKLLDDDSPAILDIVVDIDVRENIEWKLSAIDEKLAMIYCNGEGIFEIWVMNEYGIDNSWTRLLQIDDHSDMYLYPFAYGTNGLMLIDKPIFVIDKTDKDLGHFFYDIENRSFKKIPLKIKNLAINGLTKFVETLVPVRRCN